MSGDPGDESKLIRVGDGGCVGIDDVLIKVASFIQVLLTEAEKSTAQGAWMLARESGRVGGVKELEWQPSTEHESCGTVSWTCPLCKQQRSNSSVTINDLTRHGCRAVKRHIQSTAHQVTPTHLFRAFPSRTNVHCLCVQYPHRLTSMLGCPRHTQGIARLLD